MLDYPRPYAVWHVDATRGAISETAVAYAADLRLLILLSQYLLPFKDPKRIDCSAQWSYVAGVYVEAARALLCGVNQSTGARPADLPLAANVARPSLMTGVGADELSRSKVPAQ